MLTDDHIEAMLANITPGPWCYESGGGHAANCIRGSESVQVYGWKERVRLPDGSSIGNASYTDRICENLGDIQHGGPSYNVALICAAPDMARELLAAREVVRAAKALNQYETAGADEEPPHLYWEEHYMALAESVKRYDEATR